MVEQWMPQGSGPPPHVRRNATLRQIIADRQRREYIEALGYAMSLFGPGWEPSGRHSLVAHEESERARREGGRAQTHMIVTTARNDAGDTRHVIDTVPPTKAS
jgi:hypothetical protein